MKTFACIDKNNVVIGVLEMNPTQDSFEGAIAYVQVGFGEIQQIPTVGQIWDGETLSFN